MGRVGLVFFSLLGLARAEAPISTPPLIVSVDAQEAPRKILHAKLLIPAKGGELTLVYPKWLPGFHEPAGPIADLAGLQFSAAGKPILWQRDLVDMFAFHLEVPPGAAAVEASFDFLLPPNTETPTGSSTSQLAIIDWNEVILYPQGVRSDDQPCMTRLRLPKGWAHATALPLTKTSEEILDFAPVSLTTLVDSPVITGAHLRTVDLSPGSDPGHFLHLLSDSAEALEAPKEVLTSYKKLVVETLALFGTPHYKSYHFLYTLSDHVTHDGVEHHESSDNRSAERTLIDESLRNDAASLLPHELVHSWNGKYRRPIDLLTPDFQQPMKGDLLWVYEGLTEYLGAVLAARSGLWTPELFRENLALLAAELDHRPGREWRSLADTAVSAQILYDVRKEWASLRRGTDFYDEGLLVWLEADVTIRQQTQGKHSLEDFCRPFFGGARGLPSVNPYTLDDVLSGLKKVAPYDWKGFFATRVTATTPRPPLGGIEGAGWRLAYADAPERLESDRERVDQVTDLTSSIGIRVKQDGTLEDVIAGMAAARAGLGPGVKLVAVDARRWSPQILRDALKASKAATKPLELLVEDNEYYSVHVLDYHEGEKYPRLERDPTKPDLLSRIVTPLAPRLAE
jgi:predicted metalloprotease with PDZ domain